MPVTQAELQHLREQLEKLSQENPTVHRLVEMVNYGYCSFQDAMLWGVVELAKQNAELQNRLLHELQMKPPGPMILKGQSCFPSLSSPSAS